MPSFKSKLHPINKATRSALTFNPEADGIGFHSFYTNASFVEYVQRYRFLLPRGQVDPSVHTEIMIHRNNRLSNEKESLTTSANKSANASCPP